MTGMDNKDTDKAQARQPLLEDSLRANHASGGRHANLRDGHHANRHPNRHDVRPDAFQFPNIHVLASYSSPFLSVWI
ncbi:hypothetical protein BXP28_20725 [Paenibacillus larvae subsp. larvae]|nr:hypothetical protein BXP28_20725 [Paenibacillus larvae subsp. larvae]